VAAGVSLLLGAGILASDRSHRQTWSPPVSRTSAVEAPITMRLPFAASSVSVARQRLQEWLTTHGKGSDVVEDARVVVSELVANSVRHARPLPDGQIVVSWSLEPRGLRLEVTDGGAGTRPRNINASPSALAGRGMAIVGVLTNDWWTERSPTRSTVHALLPS
jgi:serine/threonine-protein kinase RsbW